MLRFVAVPEAAFSIVSTVYEETEETTESFVSGGWDAAESIE
jgi:hypothetical protein